MKNLPKKIFGFLTLLLLLHCPLILFAATENVQNINVIPNLLDDEDEDYDKLDEQEQDAQAYDPLERMNRFFFEVNDQLYIWAVKPLTQGYSWLLPQELRDSFGNFFLNIGFPVNFLNSLLQGDFRSMTILVERFVINSTLGVCGLVDVAAGEFDIGPRRADFGQTLGRWGVGEGIFIYWPLVGPSNLRDSLGLAADTFAKPIPYLYDNKAIDLAVYSTERINALSLNPDLYEDLKRYSLDPYVAARQVYTEYRRGIIVRH